MPCTAAGMEWLTGLGTASEHYHETQQRPKPRAAKADRACPQPRARGTELLRAVLKHQSHAQQALGHRAGPAPRANKHTGNENTLCPCRAEPFGSLPQLPNAAASQSRPVKPARVSHCSAISRLSGCVTPHVKKNINKQAKCSSMS